jgi:hypothetical protein
MAVGRQPVEVRLTAAQTLRMERLGECFVADGEIERRRSCPASGSDAAVMGRKRAQHGGDGAVEIRNIHSLLGTKMIFDATALASCHHN